MSRKVIGPLLAILASALIIAACGGDNDQAQGGNGDELQANAGGDFSVAVGEWPTFDGCASNGDIANYQWVIIKAPSGMQSDVGTPIREFEPECSFTFSPGREAAMTAGEVGRWVIELTVSDNDGKTSDDTVSVTVTQ